MFPGNRESKWHRMRGTHSTIFPHLKVERGKPIGNLDKSAKELNDVNDMLSRKQRRVFW